MNLPLLTCSNNNNYLQPYTGHRHPAKILLVCISILLLLTIKASAQQADSGVIDISHIRFHDPIINQCWFIAAPKGTISNSQLPQLQYKKGKINQQSLSKYIEQDNFLKFTLYNGADTAVKMFFVPGIYTKNIELFKAPASRPDSFFQLPDSITRTPVFELARIVRLQPHEQAVFYCRFNFVRTNVNIFVPRLIEHDYLKQWLQTFREKDRLLDIFTYVVTGILLLMIFYSLAVYVQNRNNEFIYYSLYAFCTTVLLFLKSFNVSEAGEFKYFYEEYLDFMILCGSVFFYLFFVRVFINTKENHPILHRCLNVANWVLLVLCLVFSAIYFLTDKYVILNIMENLVIKFVFFVIGLIFIIYSFKHNDTLLYYLAAGNSALVVFAILSLGVIQFGWKFSSDQASIVNRGLFYYEIGLVIEMICFLQGLAYKNRRDIIERVKERERLKLENERKEFDKKMAVIKAQQEERNRISADMHDELGSGMTAIRLMSEIVKTKMKDTSIPELEKISNSANDLLGKMNTIIWTMKSSNDTLESLVAYLRAHALEYFDSTPIECTVKVPPVIPQTDISGEKRRNIFLSVKEGLNNAMKHSQANHILIDIATRDSQLIIKVTDNGVGIDTEKLRRFGNGLSNMRRRMESIGGNFTIESNGNTVLTFETPI
ncbi:MAG: 7TM diverse intracellular signaling domain-containing protein [Chitinophagaceae bacterium]